jgi:putative transposase
LEKTSDARVEEISRELGDRGEGLFPAPRLVGMNPKTYRHASRRGDDADVRGHLRALANERRRFGYRRLHILPRRQGIALNHKKLFRLYREERLMVRRRGGRKRALGARAPMAVPQGPNQRWSLDFAADALVDSRRFRILALVDDFSRECLALVADPSLSGVRVARELDRLVEFRGAPLRVVSDNGTELTSSAVLRWQEERGVEWHYIAPGKPQQKRLRRELHRAVARRVSQRAPVRQPRPGAPLHRSLEEGLQRPAAAYEPQRARTHRVCQPG